MRPADSVGLASAATRSSHVAHRWGAAAANRRARAGVQHAGGRGPRFDSIAPVQDRPPSLMAPLLRRCLGSQARDTTSPPKHLAPASSGSRTGKMSTASPLRAGPEFSVTTIRQRPPFIPAGRSRVPGELRPRSPGDSGSRLRRRRSAYRSLPLRRRRQSPFARHSLRDRAEPAHLHQHLPGVHSGTANTTRKEQIVITAPSTASRAPAFRGLTTSSASAFHNSPTPFRRSTTSPARNDERFAEQQPLRQQKPSERRTTAADDAACHHHRPSQ